MHDVNPLLTIKLGADRDLSWWRVTLQWTWSPVETDGSQLVNQEADPSAIVVPVVKGFQLHSTGESGDRLEGVEVLCNPKCISSPNHYAQDQ